MLVLHLHDNFTFFEWIYKQEESWSCRIFKDISLIVNEIVELPISYIVSNLTFLFTILLAF